EIGRYKPFESDDGRARFLALKPLPETPMTRSATGLALALLLAVTTAARAEAVRYAGSPAELSVSAVSDRTVQITVAPLNDKGPPRPSPPSTVLVDQRPDLKLRRRELHDTEEVAVGKLRVRVKVKPLTLSVRGPGDKVVQELTLAEADGSLSFR